MSSNIYKNYSQAMIKKQKKGWRLFNQPKKIRRIAILHLIARFKDLWRDSGNSSVSVPNQGRVWLGWRKKLHA